MAIRKNGNFWKFECECGVIRNIKGTQDVAVDKMKEDGWYIRAGGAVPLTICPRCDSIIQKGLQNSK